MYTKTVLTLGSTFSRLDFKTLWSSFSKSMRGLSSSFDFCFILLCTAFPGESSRTFQVLLHFSILHSWPRPTEVKLFPSDSKMRSLLREFVVIPGIGLPAAFCVVPLEAPEVLGSLLWWLLWHREKGTSPHPRGAGGLSPVVAPSCTWALLSAQAREQNL